MSASSIASVASSSRWVPGGPMTTRGLGWNDRAQRMVKMSLRSVMWSLWRWVRITARKAGAPEPAAAARIRTPRPQSKRRSPAVVRTSVDGPARCGSGSGLPLPRMITFIWSRLRRPGGGQDELEDRLIRGRRALGVGELLHQGHGLPDVVSRDGRTVGRDDARYTQVRQALNLGAEPLTVDQTEPRRQ